MKTSRAAALAAAVLAGTQAAVAVPVVYDFSVTATDGPLSGSAASGIFSFDSGIIPPGGGGVGATGLFTSLALTWDNIAYSAATANTGFLGFDASGALTTVYFGTNCGVGSCSAEGRQEQWYVSGDFTYTTPTDTSIHGGNFIMSPAAVPVPEPSPMVLAPVGLAGLTWSLRRRRAGREHSHAVKGA